jgi:hypothetical protein
LAQLPSIGLSCQSIAVFVITFPIVYHNAFAIEECIYKKNYDLGLEDAKKKIEWFYSLYILFRAEIFA